MVDIQVLRVENHQSSIYVSFDVKSLGEDKSAFITAMHIRNNIRSELAILEIGPLTTDHTRIKNTKIPFRTGRHTYKFKMVQKGHWNGISRLDARIHDKSMKVIHTIDVCCPIEIIKQSRITKISKVSEPTKTITNFKNSKKAKVLYSDDEDEEVDSEGSDFKPASQNPEKSEKQESQELQKMQDLPSEPQKPQHNLSFWDLIHAIDMMGPEQSKLLDEEIRLQQTIINGLEAELKKHKNMLEDAHIKKRKISRISE